MQSKVFNEEKNNVV